MAYPTPPLTVQVTLTSNAVIGTTNTTQIIAAPGAGLRIRLVAYAGWITRNATGIIDCSLLDNVPAGYGGFTLGAGAAVSAVNSHAGFVIPEPGVPIATNSLLNAVYVATVATQGFRILVHYFIDAV